MCLCGIGFFLFVHALCVRRLSLFSVRVVWGGGGIKSTFHKNERHKMAPLQNARDRLVSDRSKYVGVIIPP